jgi:hypothetical protein
VPDGYDEKAPLGRPEEKASDRNTQDNAFGKDRIGSIGMKVDKNESDSIRPQYKGGSPLALELTTKTYSKNKTLLEGLAGKKLAFKNDQESLLDESQLLNE